MVSFYELGRTLSLAVFHCLQTIDYKVGPFVSGEVV